MFRNCPKIIRLKQEGQTLLLSLLILAGVSAAGIGFATLIINLIQGAENIDNSITAFYASRSGMEQSLYLIKTDRRAGRNLNYTVGDLRLLTEMETTFNNPALTVEIVYDEIKSVEQKHNFHLAKDESEQIDLYDPNQSIGGGLGIDNLWISWDNNPCDFGDSNYTVACGPPSPPNCCIGSGDEWVEISWTGWDTQGNSYENVNKILLSSLDLDYDDENCPEAGGIQCYIIPLKVFPGLPETIFYYQVRVKALYNKIDDLEVRALGAEPSYYPFDIPARLSLKTIGKFGRSQQALSASLPWRFPTSGLFDYVIFTEKELKKVPGNP